MELPCVNDDVSKLKHMGKETVKKLRNLAESARQAGLDLPSDIPVQRVTKGWLLYLVLHVVCITLPPRVDWHAAPTMATAQGMKQIAPPVLRTCMMDVCIASSIA